MVFTSMGLKAIELATGKEINVSVDLSYHNRGDGTVPIKFPENIWVKGAQAGTWYVNEEGYVTCGISPNGYEGRFRVIMAR